MDGRALRLLRRVVALLALSRSSSQLAGSQPHRARTSTARETASEDGGSLPRAWRRNLSIPGDRSRPQPRTRGCRFAQTSFARISAVPHLEVFTELLQGVAAKGPAVVA